MPRAASANLQRPVRLSPVGTLSLHRRQDRLASVYPVLKGACEFYQDFLVTDPKSGYKVVSPSNSPENHPGLGSYEDAGGKKRSLAVFSGVTMDNQMVYDLLNNTALAAGVLGVDSEFAACLDSLKAQLPPMHVGKYGQLGNGFKTGTRSAAAIDTSRTSGGFIPATGSRHTPTPELFRAAKNRSSDVVTPAVAGLWVGKSASGPDCSTATTP